MKILNNGINQYRNNQTFKGNDRNKDNIPKGTVSPAMEYYSQGLKTVAVSSIAGLAAGFVGRTVKIKLKDSDLLTESVKKYITKPNYSLKLGAAVAATTALLLAPIAIYKAKREIYDKKMDDKFDEMNMSDNNSVGMVLMAGSMPDNAKALSK